MIAGRVGAEEEEEAARPALIAVRLSHQRELSLFFIFLRRGFQTKETIYDPFFCLFLLLIYK